MAPAALLNMLHRDRKDHKLNHPISIFSTEYALLNISYVFQKSLTVSRLGIVRPGTYQCQERTSKEPAFA